MTNKEIIEEYFDIFRLRGYAETTITNYEYDFNSLDNFLNKSFLEVTTRDIRKYLGIKSRELKQSTIVNKINVFSSLFTFLKEEGYIDKSPMERIQKPNFNDNERRYLNLEEIEMIRLEINDLFKIMLFELLYSSGMRVSEAHNLNWSDINFRTREIHIRHGKGDKARMTKMSIKTSLLLKKYRQTRKDDNVWVLQSNYKNRMSTESIQRHIKQLGEIDGVDINLTPHKLRHTFATTLSRKNIPVEIIKELLGHDSLDTTMGYIEVSKENIDFNYNQAF